MIQLSPGMLLLALAAVALHPFPHFGAGCVRADYTSAGVPIRAERCGPPRGRAAVVVLHGCGGFDTFDHRLAVGLPAFGIATLYVDYFDPTPPPGRKGFCTAFPRGTDVFSTWERVASDGARVLRRSYAHVGAVGWSLGAGVALAAATSSRAFDAVAAFSAFAAPETLAAIGTLPPTIFLDGGRHDIVPPADARALYRAARAAHVPTALFVDGNGTHNWPGAQGSAGLERAAAFLRRYLG
jgi:dienelactone hydrolase